MFQLRDIQHIPFFQTKVVKFANALTFGTESNAIWYRWFSHYYLTFRCFGSTFYSFKLDNANVSWAKITAGTGETRPRIICTEGTAMMFVPPEFSTRTPSPLGPTGLEASTWSSTLRASPWFPPADFEADLCHWNVSISSWPRTFFLLCRIMSSCLYAV